MITPLHHYRVQKVIKAFGTQHMQYDATNSLIYLKALKYRLAPIFAINEIEQDKFYKLFDKYIEEYGDISNLKPIIPFEDKETEVDKPPALAWYENIPRWVWLSTSAIVLSFGLYLLKPSLEQLIATKENHICTALTCKIPNCAFQFIANEVPIGSELKAENITEYDTTRAMHYTWEIFDKNADLSSTEPEHQSHEVHLIHPITSVEKGNYEKVVRLIAHDTLTPPHFYRDTAPLLEFLIVCQQKPKTIPIQKNIIGGIADVDSSIQFSLLNPEKKVTYEWDFGEGNAKKIGIAPTYTYEQEGVYEVIVTATKDTLGHCETILKESISVGKEQAPLTFKDPVADVVTSRINFRSYLWWLLGLIPALAWLYYLWKENKTKIEQAKEAEKNALLAAAEINQKKLMDTFAAPDKAPYFIPYQNNDGLIRMSTQTYRMADFLRARQEGLRKELDIPKTVQQTIEKGGFPDVAFQYATQPAEYLFLLDEKEAHSHQKRLFQFLTNFLRAKDIHIQVYWYRGSMHQFWNKQTPKGIQLKVLRRLYPLHKLVIMGDGHQLLNPYGGTNLLLPEFAQFIEGWKNRVLLSPRPVISWTYREAAIAQVLLPFPADLEGFRAALPYLEMDQETLAEQVPEFDQWKKLLQKEEPQPNVNYKKWKKLKNYQNYLGKRLDLYRWLAALAVHPQPTWELTIAIGRALEGPEQELVTYDNLLILSHIPWLQGEDLSPRLRKELLLDLNQLDSIAEEKARKAVQAALYDHKVVLDVKDSHANFEWQRERIFQQFALQPTDVENNRQLRFLLDKLSKRQTMALEQSLEKYYQTDTFSDKSTTTPELSDFLNQTIEAAEKGERTNKKEVPKTQWGWWLYLALGTTILAFPCLGAMLGLNGSDKLFQFVKGKAPEPIICDSLPPLSSTQLLFVKENCAKPSEAVELNNQAVKIWGAGAFNLNNIDSITYATAINARDTFQLALLADNDNYPLAQYNLDKLHYNLGTAYYETYFKEGQTDTSLLANAFEHFTKLAGSDSLILEGAHAIGLVHHYQKRDTLAELILQEILKRDSFWFDSLLTFPHLKSLLTNNLSYRDSLLETIKNRNIEGVCRRIANVNSNLALRKSRLSQAQLNRINRNTNSTPNFLLITRIPLNREVQLLDSIDNYYAVKYNGDVGWIVKFNKGKSTLKDCQTTGPSPTTYTIKGVVRDERRNPIPKVRVRIREDNKIVTYTNGNGVFTINFRENRTLLNRISRTQNLTLEFSKQGYQREFKSVKITNSTQTIIVSLKSIARPDLKITAFQMKPTTPTQGEKIYMQAIVKNLGNADAGKFQIKWWSSTSAPQPAYTTIINSLKAGKQQVFSFQYDGYQSWYAKITSKLEIDENNSIRESNESNNVLTKFYRVKKNTSAKPDLIITAFQMNPTTPTKGEKIYMQAVIKNLGNADVGKFTIKWWASTTAPQPAYVKTINSLKAGKQQVFSFQYDGYPSWYGTITSKLEIDGDKKINESNENNNVLTKTYPVKKQK